jgi:autotransporter-associated beta strand protein
MKINCTRERASFICRFLFALPALFLAMDATGGTITNTWSGGGGDDNWSTAGNWDIGAPGETSTVFFTPVDAAPDQFTPNNIVESSRTIDSLFYWTTNSWQTTLIPAGSTLSVTGSVTIPLRAGFTTNWVLFCGKDFQDAPTTANAAIQGAGSLVVSNTTALMSVRCYGGYATLDMSGLNYFEASVKQLTVGAEGWTQAALQNRPAGILYLAKTNLLRGFSTTTTPAGSGMPLAVGENVANAGPRSFVYLGVSNVMLADFGMVIGGARSLATMQFNPTNEVPGTAFFRNLAGTGRQSEWRIGDDNTSSTGTSSDGVVDFTGGTVDARVDLIYVGRGLPANNVGAGTGTLSIGNGLVDVNTLRVGYMRTSGGAASGTVTTIGGATLTNLIVNNDLVMGFDIGANNAVGTLNIGSSVIVKGNIIGGGGSGNTINLSDGALSVGGRLGNIGGVNDQPLDTINLISGTLTLNLGIGNPITPMCNVSNLNIGSVTLNLQGSGLSPGVVPLIKYYSSGTLQGITLGSLPPQVTGSLSNSADTLYLVITAVESPKWNGNVNGDWDIDTTANWLTGGTGLPTTYHQASVPGDGALFDDSATGTTTVNLTTELSPVAVTVNNSSKTYSFVGSGDLAGPGGMTKQGTGTLVLGNSGTNSFTGAVTVGGGTLRMDGSDHRLPTNAVVNLADAAGTTLDLNGFNQQLTAIAGGGASGGNISLGNGTLTVSGNGSTFGGILSGTGSLFKIGSGNQILAGANTYGSTTISNGTLTVINSSGSGVGSGSLFIAGGTLQIGNGGTAGSIDQTVITNNGTLRINRSDDLVLNKTIVGTGGLTKAAGNVVSLLPGNTYTGTTSIEDGALRIDDPTAVGPGLITIGGNAGARLELTNNITLARAIRLTAKSGTLGAPPHIQSLGGTNTLVSPVEGTGTTEWSFQSHEGSLLVVANYFTNSGGSTTLDLRGVGAGEWQNQIYNGGTAGSVTSLTKRDTGTWTLTSSSTNTYTGVTTLMANGGTLVVNGAILNSAGVAVGVNSTLAGSGYIACGVTNGAVSFLAPGSAPNNSVGALTISNWLSLSAGATCIFEVSHGGFDQVRGLTGVVLGGTLEVLSAGPIYGGDSYKLFDAQTYQGNFLALDLPPLDPPFSWDTTDLETQGILRVVGPTIVIGGSSIVGGNMQFSGSGPANNAYRIFATTNISQAFNLWTEVGSGTFGIDGSFNFTDPNTGLSRQRFYRLVSP